MNESNTEFEDHSGETMKSSDSFVNALIEKVDRDPILLEGECYLDKNDGAPDDFMPRSFAAQCVNEPSRHRELPCCDDGNHVRRRKEDNRFIISGRLEAGLLCLPGAYSITRICDDDSSRSSAEGTSNVTSPRVEIAMVPEGLNDVKYDDEVYLQAELYHECQSGKLRQLREQVHENMKQLRAKQKPFRRIKVLTFAIAFSAAAASVAVICCIMTHSKKNQGERYPTLSPSHSTGDNVSTSMPLAAFSPPGSTAPKTESTCFQSKSDLMDAVDAYLMANNGGSQSYLSDTVGIPIGSWCTSGIDDFSDMFSLDRNPNTSSFNESLSGWDTSRGQTFRKMFQGTKRFDQDLSMWDMSRATDLSWMFNMAVSFNSNISNWNVSRVVNFEGMFMGAELFNVNLVSWDMSSAVLLTWMFTLARKFNQGLSSWTVSKVENMGSMFQGASSYNGNISSWDVSNVENMDHMFEGSSFNHDMSSWNVINVRSTEFMFQDASDFDQDLSSWDTRQLTSAWSMFERAVLFNQNLCSWDVSHVTTFKSMFAGATKFNQNLSLWNVSSSGADLTKMFEAASAFNQNLCAWGRRLSESNIGASMSRMFAGTSCSNVSDPNLLDLPPGPFCFPC